MKVLILSMHQEKEYVEKALSVGADGYLLKQDSSNELFSAIEKIRQGGVYLSPLLNDNKIGRF
jgi:DNA-binding NarL/FixJ family response regulator